MAPSPPSMAEEDTKSQKSDVLSVQSRAEPPAPTKPMAKHLAKTRFCKHQLRGYCRYEDQCAYAHSTDELLPRPNFLKTKVCVNFLAGTCNNQQCTYAHGLTELMPRYSRGGADGRSNHPGSSKQSVISDSACSVGYSTAVTDPGTHSSVLGVPHPQGQLQSLARSGPRPGAPESEAKQLSSRLLGGGREEAGWPGEVDSIPLSVQQAAQQAAEEAARRVLVEGAALWKKAQEKPREPPQAARPTEKLLQQQLDRLLAVRMQQQQQQQQQQPPPPPPVAPALAPALAPQLPQLQNGLDGLQQQQQQLMLQQQQQQQLQQQKQQQQQQQQQLLQLQQLQQMQLQQKQQQQQRQQQQQQRQAQQQQHVQLPGGNDWSLMRSVLTEFVQMAIPHNISGEMSPPMETYSLKATCFWGRISRLAAMAHNKNCLMEGSCLLQCERRGLVAGGEHLVVSILLKEPSWVPLFPTLVKRCSALAASRLRPQLASSEAASAMGMASPSPALLHVARLHAARCGGLEEQSEEKDMGMPMPRALPASALGGRAPLAGQEEVARRAAAAGAALLGGMKRPQDLAELVPPPPGLPGPGELTGSSYGRRLPGADAHELCLL